MSKNIQGDAYHGGENRDGMLNNTLTGGRTTMDTRARTSTFPGTNPAAPPLLTLLLIRSWLAAGAFCSLAGECANHCRTPTVGSWKGLDRP